ncbi:MAG: sulfatase-like hydrolase/transferase [Phycisphaeraceae bacterium]|nr:sulfatase-like hydrolase/transferase [Phycisphaeraceae bacterium]
MSNKRPNVLIMMADDHRSQAIAAHGDLTVKTPNMDRLIREGTTFTSNWHTGSYSPAVCIPTRAALHTGTNVYQASLHKDYRCRYHPSIGTINPDRVTLGQTFRQQGYHTHFIGKWHNDKTSFNRSFCDGAQIFFGGMSDHYAVNAYDYDPTGLYDESAAHITPKHSTELFTDAALDFLNHHDADKPFYLNVAFTSPHDPRQSPQAYQDMYPVSQMPLPENFQQHPFDQGHNRIRDEELASFPRDEAEIRQHISDYYAIITHQDHHMGLILDALEKRGELENTLIVYTADHGLAVGQHGLMGKQNMYEHSVRVPLILRGPGVPQGLQSHALTQTPDLYPTLIDLLGLQCPETVTANSLVPVMQGEPSSRSHQFSLYFEMQRSVCDGRYKLIRYYTQTNSEIDESQGCDKIQLFDLQNDPLEIRDLSKEPQSLPILTSLAQALQTQMDQYDDALKNVPILI